MGQLDTLAWVIATIATDLEVVRGSSLGLTAMISKSENASWEGIADLKRQSAY